MAIKLLSLLANTADEAGEAIRTSSQLLADSVHEASISGSR